MQVLSYRGHRKPTLLRVARNCAEFGRQNFVFLLRGRHFSGQRRAGFRAVLGQGPDDFAMDADNQGADLGAYLGPQRRAPGAGGGAVAAMDPAVAISFWGAPAAWF